MPYYKGFYIDPPDMERPGWKEFTGARLHSIYNDRSFIDTCSLSCMRGYTNYMVFLDQGKYWAADIDRDWDPSEKYSCQEVVGEQVTVTKWKEKRYR